jgi:Carboxypeptidase regulatory-like domain
MNRTLTTSSLLLVFASALAAQTIVPPPPPPPPPPSSEAAQSPDLAPQRLAHLSGPASFTISGVVVSATTGTPLDRAEVSLSPVGEAGSPVADSITTENGSFRFDHLQAGKYRLEASRRGYISAGYQDHDGLFTAIVTGPNLATGGLRLELLPTAVVGGVVTDDSGEPVTGAMVRLFRQDHAGGQDRVLAASTDVTDDTGAYEFARLRAGTYYVSISASPWYAFRPIPKTDDSGNVLPADQQPHFPLDVAYPTTFYADATDSDSASPIVVSAGDRVDASFPLHAVPAIHIQIRLQSPGENHGIPMPQLVQQVFGADQYQPASQFMMGTKNGSIIVADLGGIAPGHYLLRQFAEQGQGTRIANIDLTSDQTVDFAQAAAGGVDISGKLAMVSGEKFPGRTSVVLMPANGDPSIPPARVAPDGAFELHSIAPGVYDCQIRATGATLGVAQIAVSGAESHGTRITVAAEPVLIAATLARGVTTLTGYVKQSGKGIGGMMILLVPRDPNAGAELYRRDQSDSDGSFTMNRVVPGDYTLVAIDNGWTLDWARHEVVAPYLARGIRLRVTGQKNLDLPTALEVQPR